MVEPFDVSPLTSLWRILDNANICIYHEYMKVAKIAIIQVLLLITDVLEKQAPKFTRFSSQACSRHV